MMKIIPLQPHHQFHCYAAPWCVSGPLRPPDDDSCPQYDFVCTANVFSTGSPDLHKIMQKNKTISLKGPLNGAWCLYVLCDTPATIHKYHVWTLEGYWDWSRLVTTLSLTDELVFSRFLCFRGQQVNWVGKCWKSALVAPLTLNNVLWGFCLNLLLVFQAGVLVFYSSGLGQSFKGGVILTSQMSPGKARGSSSPLQVTTWSLIIGIQSFSLQEISE